MCETRLVLPVASLTPAGKPAVMVMMMVVMVMVMVVAAAAALMFVTVTVKLAVAVRAELRLKQQLSVTGASELLTRCYAALPI